MSQYDYDLFVIGAGSGGGIGACTLLEHNAGTLVRDAAGSTQDCTSARVASGQCDARWESAASQSGTDEAIPKLSLCQKAFDHYFGKELFTIQRNLGRLIHESVNSPAAGDNSDATGAE